MKEESVIKVEDIPTFDRGGEGDHQSKYRETTSSGRLLTG